jgi:hypothetical protein
MFFRRPRPYNPTLDERLDAARRAGFEVTVQPGGGACLRKGACAALVSAASGSVGLDASGLWVDGEIARLVDAGFQKFFLLPSGRRLPASAAQLRTLHDFEDEAREALGLAPLYNESLGTVNAAHQYDRLVLLGHKKNIL